MKIEVKANGYVWEEEVATVEDALEEMELNPINGEQCKVTFENGYEMTHYYIDSEDDGEQRADILYELHQETGLPYA